MNILKKKKQERNDDDIKQGKQKKKNKSIRYKAKSLNNFLQLLQKVQS